MGWWVGCTIVCIEREKEGENTEVKKRSIFDLKIWLKNQDFKKSTRIEKI